MSHFFFIRITYVCCIVGREEEMYLNGFKALKTARLIVKMMTEYKCQFAKEKAELFVVIN